MKAKFMERQPSVRWQPINAELVDVTICLNETKVSVEQGGNMEGQSVPMDMWEYDFHQFREKFANIKEADVRKSPINYLTYVPAKEPTVEEKIEQMQLSNDMAIAELSILIGSLMTPQV